MYPIRDIDRSRAEDIEYLGTKRKFWLTLGGERYLFKAEERGTGEDWAEKIVCELARILGLPHVEYELAHECDGPARIQPGVVCPSFASPPLSLEMGNQLLVRRNPSYSSHDQAKYKVHEYTIEAVAEAVETLLPPDAFWMKNAPTGIDTALDIFAGYLMLDAWVANQDRHHQNWGAIRDGETLHLAPTYDHGSSLARNLEERDRQERLTTKDRNRTIETFVTKARSGFYRTPDDKKTILALDAWREFSRFAFSGSEIWMGRLATIRTEEIENILNQIPVERMTPVCREFTLQLLRINQRRILEET